jgi:malate/lactate dehydrogenase
VIAKLGARGLEEIPILELNAEEKMMFEKSAAAVKELVDAMEKLGV